MDASLHESTTEGQQLREDTSDVQRGRVPTWRPACMPTSLHGRHDGCTACRHHCMEDTTDARHVRVTAWRRHCVSRPACAMHPRQLRHWSANLAAAARTPPTTAAAAAAAAVAATAAAATNSAQIRLPKMTQCWWCLALPRAARVLRHGPKLQSSSSS
eukprot:352952-Chlamydomonas_euryale.AAC.5